MINFTLTQFKLLYTHDLCGLWRWLNTGQWSAQPMPPARQLPAPKPTPLASAVAQPTAIQAQSTQYVDLVTRVWSAKMLPEFGNRATAQFYRRAIVGPRLVCVALQLTHPDRKLIETAKKMLPTPLQAVLKTNDVSVAWEQGQMIIQFPHPQPWSPGADHVLQHTPAATSLQSRIDRRQREDLTAFVGLDKTGNPITVQLHEAPMLGFIGSTGYGKSTCIKAALYGLCQKNDSRRIQFAVLAQKTGGWSLLKQWPHCIGVYGPNDMADIAQLVKRLRDDVAARSEKVENGWDLSPSTILILDDAPDVLAANPKIVDDLDIIFRSGREPRIYCWLSAQGAGEKAMTGSTSMDNNISVRIGFYAPNAGAAYRNFGRSGIDLTQLTRAGDAYISLNGARRLVTAYVPDEELTSLCNDGEYGGLGVGDSQNAVSDVGNNTPTSGRSDVNSVVIDDVQHSSDTDTDYNISQHFFTAEFRKKYRDYLPDSRVSDIGALTELECVACLWAIESKDISKRKLMTAMFGNVGTPQNNKLSAVLERGQAVLDSLQPTSDDVPVNTDESNDLDILDQIDGIFRGNDNDAE